MRRAIIFGALLLPVAVAAALFAGVKIMPKPDVEKVPPVPMEGDGQVGPPPTPTPSPTPTPREPGE